MESCGFPSQAVAQNRREYMKDKVKNRGQRQEGEETHTHTLSSLVSKTQVAENGNNGRRIKCNFPLQAAERPGAGKAAGPRGFWDGSNSPAALKKSGAY